MGYTNVKVFHAGLPAWKKAGGLLVVGPVGVSSWMQVGTSFILVDLRDPAEVAEGHIPGAIGIPAKDLASWKDRFPADKKAPIVLVDAGQASAEAFATVRGWGYVNASVLKGGMGLWQAELAKGPAEAPAKIEYVKKLKPGEIGIDEFKQVVDTRPEGVLILDVREQPVDAVLPGALAIPQSALAARIAEVPKDKEVVVHCNTGILAKFAYDALAAAGHPKVRYLDAVIVVGTGGTYDIAEK